jgi:hypothetical protein
MYVMANMKSLVSHATVVQVDGPWFVHFLSVAMGAIACQWILRSRVLSSIVGVVIGIVVVAVGSQLSWSVQIYLNNYVVEPVRKLVIQSGPFNTEDVHGLLGSWLFPLVVAIVASCLSHAYRRTEGKRDGEHDR